MDWIKESVTFGSGLVLGAMSALVWPLVRDKISERKARAVKAAREAQILEHLDKIEDSTFDHATLSDPPYCCDQVEEDLSFLKLCILPLVAKAWDPAKIEEEEKRLLMRIWTDVHKKNPWAPFHKSAPPAPSGYDPELWYKERASRGVEEWYEQWKDYRFMTPENENLAMAVFVNRHRKRPTS